MPVNDWTRTSLNHPMEDGSLALYFNWIDLAVFDIHLLKRPGADTSYSEKIVLAAEQKFKNYTKLQLDAIAGVVMFGIPGEAKTTTNRMLEKLATYKHIDHAALQDNLCHFLSEISPVAEESGIKLAIHPDDPPFPILGLPRIMSNLDDMQHIIQKVPNPANGICFCTGSLGASEKNDLPQMVKSLGNRIHFVHLRNTKRDLEGNFFEADHLGGNSDMYAVMKELLLIQEAYQVSLPFRPDHGHQMLDDLSKETNPGYSAIGRLRGLAELRGLELGISRSLQERS